MHKTRRNVKSTSASDDKRRAISRIGFGVKYGSCDRVIASSFRELRTIDGHWRLKGPSVRRLKLQVLLSEIFSF